MSCFVLFLVLVCLFCVFFVCVLFVFGFVFCFLFFFLLFCFLFFCFFLFLVLAFMLNFFCFHNGVNHDDFTYNRLLWSPTCSYIYRIALHRNFIKAGCVKYFLVIENTNMRLNLVSLQFFLANISSWLKNTHFLVKQWPIKCQHLVSGHIFFDFYLNNKNIICLLET